MYLKQLQKDQSKKTGEGTGELIISKIEYNITKITKVNENLAEKYQRVKN